MPSGELKKYSLLLLLDRGRCNKMFSIRIGQCRKSLTVIFALLIQLHAGSISWQLLRNIKHEISDWLNFFQCVTVTDRASNYIR